MSVFLLLRINSSRPRDGISVALKVEAYGGGSGRNKYFGILLKKTFGGPNEGPGIVVGILI